MGSRGDAYDNAVAVSFFATLKKELIRRHSSPTRRELIGEVFDYIEAFYNPSAGTRRSATSPRRSPSFALRAQNPRQSSTRRTPPNQPCPPRRGHSTTI